MGLATSSSKSPVSTCLTERPSSRMPTCLSRCSKTLWTVPRRRSRNTTSRRTSPPTSRRSLTKSTTRPGTALWEELRLLRHPRDQAFHLLLPGSSRHTAVQERLNLQYFRHPVLAVSGNAEAPPLLILYKLLLNFAVLLKW